MLLVKNGNFCALVLTEAIFGERLLPVKIHRRLPFEEPHSLVYGCYPDEATVRLILNVEALAVHFNKTLFKEFFTNLSQKIALEPMDIGLEPERETTEVGGGPVQKANEQIEEDIEPVELAEAEELFEPEESPALITFTAAEEVEEKRDIKETAEIAPPDIMTAAVADSEEISAAEDKTDFEETQKSAETKTEGTHVSDSEEFGPEPELEATELSGPIKEPEKPAEPEISEKQTAETKLEVLQTEVSEQIVPGLEPDTTDVDGFTQKAKEQIEEGIEPVEFAETKEPFEPEEPRASIAFVEAEEAEEKREIKEVAEVAPPGIATAAADSEELSAADEKTAFQEAPKIAKIKAQGTHVTVSEVFGSEPESDAKQEEQVEEIIELTELVEIEEIIELTELVEAEKLIEIEEAPELNVLTSIADTALPDVEGVSDNSKTDAREKPKRKFVGAVFVSILLIGLLTVSLYPSGLFKTWLVDKESENSGVPVTANQLSPTKPKTSLPPKFEKPPIISKGSKLAEVQDESTETPVALSKPQPYPAKQIGPPTSKTAPVVPSGSEINEIEEVNLGAQAVFAKSEPSLAKHLNPPTPKRAPAVPSVSEIDGVEEVNSGEPAAAEVHGVVPAIALKQQAPKMVSPESTGMAIHKVEKGDTLWNISKRYTGTGFNYLQVAKENEITNPDLIFIKQKVRVCKKYGIKKE
jgi:LysM repeat protein